MWGLVKIKNATARDRKMNLPFSQTYCQHKWKNHPEKQHNLPCGIICFLDWVWVKGLPQGLSQVTAKYALMLPAQDRDSCCPTLHQDFMTCPTLHQDSMTFPSVTCPMLSPSSSKWGGHKSVMWAFLCWWHTRWAEQSRGTSVAPKQGWEWGGQTGYQLVESKRPITHPSKKEVREADWAWAKALNPQHMFHCPVDFNH